MDISTLIYCAAAFAVGLFIGLIVELAVDNGLIRDLEEENKTLRLKVEEAEQHPKGRVEIIDRRTPKSDVKFGGF